MCYTLKEKLKRTASWPVCILLYSFFGHSRMYHLNPVLALNTCVGGAELYPERIKFLFSKKNFKKENFNYVRINVAWLLLKLTGKQGKSKFVCL